MMHFYIVAPLMAMFAPPAQAEQINQALGRLADFLSGFVLGASAVMFVIVGYLWMTSGEFPSREEWAKRALGAVLIGTILVLIGKMLAGGLTAAIIGH